MVALNVITWLWGSKYTAQDVTRLQTAVKRHLSIPHRFCLFTDQALSLSSGVEVRELEDRVLTSKNCFCRLRMFDPNWQKRNSLYEPILSLDLDVIITGQLDDLVKTNSTFKILKGVNSSNPNPFNASVMYLKPGNHAEVWNDFSLERASKVPFHEFPDDQGWIWHKLPNADGWQVGPSSGIYGFQKPGWPLGFYSASLPQGARIVSFIGRRKPWMYPKVDWIKDYWKL